MCERFASIDPFATNRFVEPARLAGAGERKVRRWRYRCSKWRGTCACLGGSSETELRKIHRYPNSCPVGMERKKIFWLAKVGIVYQSDIYFFDQFFR
jgi:hypothetical protein